ALPIYSKIVSCSALFEPVKVTQAPHNQPDRRSRLNWRRQWRREQPKPLDRTVGVTPGSDGLRVFAGEVNKAVCVISQLYSARCLKNGNRPARGVSRESTIGVGNGVEWDL